MKTTKMLVGAGLASAVAFSALVSFAAKPGFAGQMPKEDKVALMQEAKTAKLQAQADKAMASANALHDKLDAKAGTLEIVVPAEVETGFADYMAQAQTAYGAGDFKQAKLFANMAKDALEPLDLLIEEAEAALEATEPVEEEPVA